MVFLVDFLVKLGVLFGVYEGLSVILLDFVQIMNCEDNINFVLLINFNFLFDFNLFAELEVSRIHHKVII